jgi:hypothetical protein
MIKKGQKYTQKYFPKYTYIVLKLSKKKVWYIDGESNKKTSCSKNIFERHFERIK